MPAGCTSWQSAKTKLLTMLIRNMLSPSLPLCQHQRGAGCTPFNSSNLYHYYHCWIENPKFRDAPSCRRRLGAGCMSGCSARSWPLAAGAAGRTPAGAQKKALCSRNASWSGVDCGLWSDADTAAVLWSHWACGLGPYSWALLQMHPGQRMRASSLRTLKTFSRLTNPKPATVACKQRELKSGR